MSQALTKEQIREIIDDSKNRISKPENWTQFRRIQFDGKNYSMCILGVIDQVIGKVSPSEHLTKGLDFLNYKMEVKGQIVQEIVNNLDPTFVEEYEKQEKQFGSLFIKEAMLANYNNTHTHADVLSLLDRTSHSLS